MSDFDKTLHAQLRHLIDDLTVAVDDDGHTRYAPKNTLMFSNFIGALIELMPTLAARAQPAQAVPVLTDDPLFVFAQEVIHGAYKPEELKDAAMRAIRHHSAVRAKMGVAVPMTDEQAKDIAQQETWGPDAIAMEAALIRAVRHAERHHGIVGKEGA